MHVWHRLAQRAHTHTMSAAYERYRAALLGLLVITVLGWVAIWNLARQFPASALLAWSAQLSNFVTVALVAFAVWQLWMLEQGGTGLRSPVEW